MRLDHVIVAVDDLAAAAAALERRTGLASVEGGRHPGWGTANRIVPLGEEYFELIAVVDEAEAAAAPFGRWVAEGPGRPLGWAVRPADLDPTAARLGLEVREGSRRTQAGELLRWRYAGAERAIAEPCFPFFIEWLPGTPFPGLVETPPARIARLHLRGDIAALDEWLGPHDLPVTVRPGRPALERIVLRRAADGEELELSGGGS